MSTYTERDLTNEDRERIEVKTRKRCADLNVLSRHGTTAFSRSLINERQVETAAEMAVALYETAARFGVQPVDADLTTNFISAAIDGIRLRDREVAR